MDSFFQAALVEADPFEIPRRILPTDGIGNSLSIKDIRKYLNASQLEVIELPNGYLAFLERGAKEQGQYVNKIATKILAATLMPNDYVCGDVIIANSYSINIE